MIYEKTVFNIAIKAAKKVYKNKAWNVWADLWISGEDRSSAAADAAAYAAHAAAYAAHAAADAAAAKKKYSRWLVEMIGKARATHD